MTMVHLPRTPALSRKRVAALVGIAGWASLAAAAAVAQDPPVHYLHAGAMPPGAIGSAQLTRGGPLPGYFQPVEITAPDGAQIALAAGGAFQETAPGPQTAGMLIGAVYRLKVTNIPGQEGLEVYPTIEVIDRLYPPIGQERRFAISVELSQEEIAMALSGKFVTRVVYLEDPENALPVPEDPKQQSYFEVAPGENPLEVADRMGRPVAILRMGARLPDADGPDEAFLYGSPPWVKFRSPAVDRVVVPPPQRMMPGDSAARGRRQPAAGAMQSAVLNLEAANQAGAGLRVQPARQPLRISGAPGDTQQVTR